MTSKSSSMFVRQIQPHAALFRDPKTGIAWVEDGSTGMGHTAHANIASSGSVAQMKRKGFWGKEDRAVRSHGFIYNIDSCIVSNDLDRVARNECRCGGNHSCDDPVLAYYDRTRRRSATKVSASHGDAYWGPPREKATFVEEFKDGNHWVTIFQYPDDRTYLIKMPIGTGSFEETSAPNLRAARKKAKAMLASLVARRRA
jgi:hypothetical protein